MKILIADANLAPHRDRLEAALPDDATTVWRPGAAVPDLLDDLRDAEVYVGARFTTEMAGAAEKLRLIHVAGAGTDRVDFSALGPDVVVANTFHHERSIAEYVLATAIVLRRDFLAQDRALRRGTWATSVYDDTIPQLGTLRDSRIGFVGFGHIGQCAWDLFRAVGCSGVAVTGSGRQDAAAYGLDWVGDTSRLGGLAREVDVMVVSAPLTPATTGMIGTAELLALGAEGVLINVGRGPLVDERALYDALVEGQIRAAAIDVWYRYPSAPGTPTAVGDMPFGELSNLVMTPHSSGVTTDTFRGRADDIAANVGRLGRGEQLRNVVSPT